MLPRLPVPARHHAIYRRVGSDLGAIEIEFLAPDQASLNTPLDDLLKEALKDFQAIAGADFTQATMIGHRFVQIITDVPTVGEMQIDHLHQLSLGTDPFKEHDELQLEKDDRINGGASHGGRIA